VHPALSIVTAIHHVFVAVVATGHWTKAIDNAVLQRIIQMGSLPGLFSPLPESFSIGVSAGPEFIENQPGPNDGVARQIHAAAPLIGTAMQP
jgi:hypothetical protein